MTPEATRRLKTLDAIVPSARPAFEALLEHAKQRGFQPYIVSAVRTCREEAGLTATKVRRSWHVLGRAVDVELHARGDLASIADAYVELGAWWESQGGIWGGRWVTLYPVPHPPGWCGAPELPGDTCHFQWTGTDEHVPVSVWPREVTACDDVDRLQAETFAREGMVWPLPAAGDPLGVVPPGGPIVSPGGPLVSTGRRSGPWVPLAFAAVTVGILARAGRRGRR